jgi:outer membrane protein assembly factor BamB
MSLPEGGLPTLGSSERGTRVAPMMGRPIRSAVVLSAVAVAFSRPSLSAPSAEIALSRSVGPPTVRVSVHGDGYGPSEKVDVLFDAVLLQVTRADPDGSFIARVRIPRTALPGDHLVIATGEDSGLTAQQPFAVHTDWPMYQFSQDRRGRNPYENVLTPSNVSSLIPGWTVELSGSVRREPILSGGRLFVVDSEGIVSALDAGTGGVLWSDDLLSLSANAAAANGIVYASDGQAFAIDQATGEVVWASSFGDSYDSAILPVGPVVYTATGEYLNELDALTGALRWSRFTGDLASGGPPAYADGMVYAATYYDGSLLAFDAKTGFLLWGASVDYGTLAPPAVADGMVLATTTAFHGGSVYAFDATTGALRWRLWDGVTDFPGAPDVVDGTVIAAAIDGDASSLYAIDEQTGAVDWVAPVEGSVESGADPVVANGVIYLADNDNHLIAFDEATGAQLWEYTSANSLSPPIVADGVVFVGSGSSVLTFHLPTG